MKKLILILLLSFTIVNAQDLLFDKKDNPELNTNTSLTIPYAELVPNGDFSVSDGWSLTTGTTISNGYLKLDADATANTYGWANLPATQYGKLLGLNYDVDTSTINATINIYQLANSLLTTSPAIPKTVGHQTYIFTANGAGSCDDLILRVLSSSGRIIIDNVSLKVLVSPTGFTSTMTATDYVSDLNGLGCKFIEVTGDTYIEMEDTLEAGWYYVLVEQVYVSGEFNVFNGTTEYPFPQSSGTFKRLVYADGTNPLRFQVDHNSDITQKKLSIKRK